MDIASIIHGQGLSVVEGVIRGGSESPIDPGLISNPSALPDPPLGRRVMRFWLKKGRKGAKLVRHNRAEGGGGAEGGAGGGSESVCGWK